ncbi:MAG: hypothetical protein IKM44_02960 [Clostridia bacterium]|nr:hypothetical protein [Clostridia bacterium]
MKTDVSKKLKSMLLNNKLNGLNEVLRLIKSDFERILYEYLKLDSTIEIVADIDESYGNVDFIARFSASEIYDVGKMIE